MSRRNSILLVAVAFAAMAGAYWMLILSPKRDEAAALGTQISTKEAALAVAQDELATYEKARDRLPRQLPQGRAPRQGRPGRRRRALAPGAAQLGRRPQQGRLPHDQPRRLVRRSRRRRRWHRRLPPPARPRRRPAARASAAPASRRCRSPSRSRAASSASGEFFNRLDRFVKVKNQGLDVTGRLLLLNSVTLQPDSAKGFPLLSAEVQRRTPTCCRRPRACSRGATAEGPSRGRGRRRPRRRLDAQPPRPQPPRPQPSLEPPDERSH